jgi:hypothetical protein
VACGLPKHAEATLYQYCLSAEISIAVNENGAEAPFKKIPLDMREYEN